MNIYYTAKDIEEMAAKGVQQVEIGPGVTLTDFARETAQQLDITLVDNRRQVSPATVPASPSNRPPVSDKYNKPTGCQHASSSLPAESSFRAVHSQAVVPASQAIEGADSNTVNRLIDLMGKVMKRGG